MGIVEVLRALPLDDATAKVEELFTTGSLQDGDVLHVDITAVVAAARTLRQASLCDDSRRQLSTILSEAGVDHRAAVVVFYRLMGGAPAAPGEAAQSALAASCYVLLLRCLADAFQPMVFRRALNALRTPPSTSAGCKRKAVAGRSSPAKRSAGGVGVDGAEQQPDEGLAGAGDAESWRWAAVQDVANLVAPGGFSLSGYTDSLANLIEVMVDIIPAHAAARGASAVGAPALAALRGTLAVQHGDPTETIKLVFQGFLPILLATPGKSKATGTTIPKVALLCRDAAVKFVSSLMQDKSGDFTQNHSVHVVALCQHMCMRASDKREFRQSAHKTIVTLLLLLPEEKLSQFTRFLTKYSKNEKALYRHFACDVSLELATRLPVATLNTSAAFAILKGRASDKAPTVRTRAISQLAACLAGPRAADLVGNGTAVTSLLTLARARSRDEKAAVRKAGVQMLCGVLRRLLTEAAELGAVCGGADETADPINPADVQIIAERCRDTSLSTRKAALQMLTELLQAAPTSTAIQNTWIKIALPAVLDQQPSMVEASCSVCFQILLAPLLLTDTDGRQLAWQLLNRVRSPDALQCLHKIVESLHTNPKFSLGPAHVGAATKEIRGSSMNQVGPWLLIAELSSLFPREVDVDLTWHSWKRMCEKLADADEAAIEQDTAVYALRTLGNSLPASRVPTAGAAIVAAVRTYAYAPQVTKSALECLQAISGNASDKSTDGAMTRWSAEILSDCDSLLYAYMFGDMAEAKANKANIQRSVVIALFIVGEIAMMEPSSIPKRVVSVLQALVNPADNAEAGSGVRVEVPESARAHAVVALGKVCLNSQPLAKKCVAAFARELQDNKADTAVIRNNIIFILTDLCRRFTSLVDPHLPLLSRCLGDPLPLVRKQTMILLAGLLQEDYLKWKGPLFHRLVGMTVDADLEIAAQAKFIMFTLFHQVDDKLLSRNFIETLFYLNDFTEHEQYNRFNQCDAERERFCMPGKDMQNKRLRIYSAMLEPMSDENRLHVTARLCHEVLARVTDTDTASAILDPSDTRASQVLHDAMVVLASKDIKLASARKSTPIIDADAEELQQPTADTATSAAKSKVLSQVAKKGTIEQTLPILVEVRRLLMERKSPLLRALMDAVRETIKDYQDEVDDILSDRQLAAEIMYDLDQMKAEANQSRRVSHSPRGLASSSPRLSNGSARLSMTPAKPTSLKDTFTPALSARRSSAGSGAQNTGSFAAHPNDRLRRADGRSTPFSVPRLRGRPSASPNTTSAAPKAETSAAKEGAMPPPSPMPSSLPLRVYNRQTSANPSRADIQMPSPFKPPPGHTRWNVHTNAEDIDVGGD